VTTLEIIRDVLTQAEEVRSVRPDVAERLSRDGRALISGMPGLTVADAAQELGISKPSVHAWIKAGVLQAARGPGNRGLLVSTGSVLGTKTALDLWRMDVGRGRALPYVRRWLRELADSERQATAVGRRRGRGQEPLLWPGGDGVLSKQTREKLSRLSAALA